MRFVCLGFIDEDKYARLSEAEGRLMMEECFEYDDELRRGGHFLGGEALQSAKNAVTLRIKNGAFDVTDGPYSETKRELLEIFRHRHELVDSAVRAKHADYFARSMPERLREFAPTIGRIAVYLLASHESYHLGQLMQWRRAAGFKKDESS